MQGVLLATVAVALALIASAASWAFAIVSDLHQAIPGAEWTGTPRVSSWLYPDVVWQSFKGRSEEQLAASLEADWVQIGATRDGSVVAYRRAGAALYIVRTDDGVRAELQKTGGCSATKVAPPLRAPDTWLEFGISPGMAIERLEGRIGQLTLYPCPQGAAWIGSREVRAFADLVVEAPTPATLLISFRPLRSEGAIAIPLGPLAPTGLVRQTGDQREIVWQLNGVWYSYSIRDARREDLARTACSTFWRSLVCEFVSGR